MEIGDRIKRERAAAGLTQEQLAKAIGVDKSAVGQWESSNSRKGITTGNLIKVAEALAIPVSRLTGENDASEALELNEREIRLVRLFRKMTPIQKDAHLQLFYVSVGLKQPLETQRDPLDGKRITG